MPSTTNCLDDIANRSFLVLVLVLACQVQREWLTNQSQSQSQSQNQNQYRFGQDQREWKKHLGVKSNRSKNTRN